jgi:TRAP transporter 4TM/12TM fusion protein
MVEKGAEVTEEKKEKRGSRIPAGWPAQAMRIITALFGVYVLLYVGGFLSMAGIYVYTGQHNILVMIVVMVLVFLQVPIHKTAAKSHVPWYDYVLLLLGVVANGYLFVDYWAILDTAKLSTSQIILGIIDIVLILEMCRRTVGAVLAAMGLFFVLHPLLANHFPSFLFGNAISLERVVGSLYLYPEGIYGSILQVITGLVMVFIILGAILEVSGAGEFFINLALSLVGTLRGGPAKVAVIGSTLMGTITGSSIANASVIGTITIPLMTRIGYTPLFAASVEAVASNGSQIMPPVLGIAAFLMVDFLQVPYRTVILAAIIPGLLYYFSLMCMVHFEANKRGLTGIPREEVPELKKVLKEGWYYLTPVIVLVYFLIFAEYSAQTACAYAILTIIPLSFLKKKSRLGVNKLTTSFSRGIQGSNTLIAVGSLAGILVASINITGVSVRMSSGLIEISGGSAFILLLLTGITCVILGGGLPTSAIYLLCATLVAPALIKSGITPIVAHFFIMYMGMSALITPPIGMAAFTTAAIAGTGFIKTCVSACILGVLTFVAPFYLVYRPALLIVGWSWTDIFTATLLSAMSTLLLALGIIGHFSKPLKWPFRILALLAGFAMIRGIWTIDMIGIAVGVFIILWQLLGGKFSAVRAVKASP